MALDKIGIDITVKEINAERLKLKRKERKNKDDVRPSKIPSHSTTDSSLEDKPTAMAPHSAAVASTPEFQGFDEHDYATPHTATLGRRLQPIFEGQDCSHLSQNLLAQEPHHVYSQYELKMGAVVTLLLLRVRYWNCYGYGSIGW